MTKQEKKKNNKTYCKRKSNSLAALLGMIIGGIFDNILPKNNQSPSMKTNDNSYNENITYQDDYIEELHEIDCDDFDLF